jgi:uncharacterized protein YeaO (DUF488 family)
MTRAIPSRRIVIKRAYEKPSAQDGYRVLVDALWPRGRSKGALALDEWAKALAPSASLRKWFGHDPQRWECFRQRYREELESPEQRSRLHALIAAAADKRLTLVYGARDEEHNQAVVLREVIAHMMHGR